MKNKLTELISDAEKYEDLIKVIDNSDINYNKRIKIYADPVLQIGILYIE